MLAFEQYRVREDLYEIHFHSKAMDVFLSKIPPTMTTGVRISSSQRFGPTGIPVIVILCSSRRVAIFAVEH